jgi:hypothetical protein
MTDPIGLSRERNRAGFVVWVRRRTITSSDPSPFEIIDVGPTRCLRSICQKISLNHMDSFVTSQRESAGGTVGAKRWSAS